jgi:glutathione S-transferase
MAAPVLWQFRYSHYNEKVRWALDYKRLPHRRRSLLPGFHIPRVLWLTGQKSVPVLVLDGETITDSTKIIEHLERRFPEPPLYPDEQEARQRAIVLENYFDEEIGPHLRRLWFHELLPDLDFTAAQLTVGFAEHRRRRYRSLFPLIRVAMKLDMKIDDAHTEASRARVIAALDRIEGELPASGYLVADRFTVADLTAAALLSPLVLPPEFPYLLMQPLPDRTARLRQSLIGRKAVQWAAEIYRKHRGTSMEVDGPS